MTVTVGDLVTICSPSDRDWHGREGTVTSIMDNLAVIELRDTGRALTVLVDQLKKESTTSGPVKE